MSEGDRRIRALLLAGAAASLVLIGGISVVVVVGSLLVMLVLHELGHYLVARWCGMQVTEFFVGFGPRLWSFRRGETEFGVKAIPAGAYVRIIGLNNLDVVDPTDEFRTYRAQSYPRKLAVMFAGSATHFLTAIILLVVIFSVIGRPDPLVWTVGQVVPGSTAEQLGVSEGDRIVSVAGVDTPNFDDFGYVVRALPSRTVSVAVARDGRVSWRTGQVGERLTPVGAAALSGAQPGDRIVAVDGRPISGWAELTSTVEEGVSYRLEVHRYLGGREAIDVVISELPNATSAVVGFFGIGPDRPLITVGPIQAVGEAFARFGDLTVASVDGLARIFTPGGLANLLGDVDDDPVDVGGGTAGLAQEDDDRLISIYGAARLGSAMFESGVHNYLLFLVLISVFVGVFNLVPLLPFDGGHLAIATYERFRSRGGRRYQADASKLIPLTWMVLTLLISVSLIALYRDIVDFPDFG